MWSRVLFSASKYLSRAIITVTALIVLIALTACGGVSNTSNNGGTTDTGGTGNTGTGTGNTGTGGTGDTGTGGTGNNGSGGGGNQQAQCPTVTLQFAKGPDTGVAPFPDPAPVPPPSPGTTANGSVCVSQPTDGSDVTSPFHLLAVASLVNPIDHMRVFIDGVATQFTFYNELDAEIFAAAGRHSVEILATDKSGNDVSTSFHVNVTGPGNPTISDIQNIPNWEPCSAKFPPGHPRAGQICAAGLGDAVSTMTEGQKEKLSRLGGPKWVRERIDEADEPND